MRSFRLAVAMLLATTPAAQAQHQRVVDPDSVLTVLLPSDWVPADLGNADATVQMTNPQETAFFLVIPESKDDLFGWNMTRFLYVTLGQNLAILDFPEMSEIEHGEVDGYPSVSVTLSGATSGQQFKYFRVGLEGPGHWIQLVFGTLRSAWDEFEPVFRETVGSVDILDDP